MCYSVMVETDLKRLRHEFGAEIDWDDLYTLLRARDEASVRADGRSVGFKVPRGLEQALAEPKTPIETRCRELMDKFTDAEVARFEAKAAQQTAKVLGFEAALAKRWSKTNQEKLETALRVRDKARYDVTRLKGPIIATDSLVHQYTFAPLAVRVGGRRLIRFYRYQVRPRWADREPNRELNLFNARLDKLEDRRTWAPLFMHQHGALAFKSFYEWVPDIRLPEAERRATIVNFMPEDRRLLWAPALFEIWQGPGGGGPERIASFAVVTTDPPPEVALMGHDRCPTHPPRAFLGDWLNPASCSRAHIYAGLKTAEPVRFDYVWGVGTDED